MIHRVRLERGAARATIARAILDALPRWFGIAEAREGYIALAARQPMLVHAEGATDTGFLVLKRHTASAWEIAVMAVRPERHRHGIGRALVDAATGYAASRGARFLTIKTLAPAARDRAYARTRAFYRAMGFAPIEVFPDLWGAENPCLIMIKPLRP